ncbi:MAG: hypothetical protein RIA69_06430 [Cyclobacteriaceae bacterium]
MLVYTYFRWLSLDIVLGAICFLLYLNNFYRLNIPIFTYVELGLAVWVIYLLDHIIDSRRKTGFHSLRHQFYKDHFKLLSSLCLFALLIAFLLLPFLPVVVLINGAILSILSLVYLAIVKFVPEFWVKELLIAIGYASGIFLVPFTLLEHLETPDILIYISLLFIALSNLIVFSLYDLSSDEKDNFPSIVQKLGFTGAKRLLVALIFVGLGIAIFLLTVSLNLGLMLISMNIVLLVLHTKPINFRKNEMFRVIGDGIFYLPVIFLLFGKL